MPNSAINEAMMAELRTSAPTVPPMALVTPAVSFACGNFSASACFTLSAVFCGVVTRRVCVPPLTSF